MVSMEWLKLLKRPMTWIIFLFLVPGTAGIMVLSYLSVILSNTDPELRAINVQSELLPLGIMNSLEIAGALGGILMVVLAAALIGSEYGWGTIRPLVGSGATRSKVFLAKLIALIEAVITFVILAIAAGCLASLALTWFEGNPITLGTVDTAWVLDLGLSIARTTFVIFVGATIAFSVAYVTRSLAAGIGIGIAWMILEQVLSLFLERLGKTGEVIRDLLISTNTNALSMRNGFGTSELPPGVPAEYQAVGVLALYCILLLGFAWLVFRRRDIASGS
ncbi:MAG TPA: ABC transporter permease subunit [Nitrolancea sp.]|nr:ABC transporter permease subunit [Nitrolancea sp.]